MAQQIINTGNVANDGTGESLRDAFTAVNQNFTEIYTAGPVGSNVVISGNTITVTGTNNNVVLAGNGIGNIQANSSIQPAIDAVYSIGGPNSRFNTVYAASFVGNGAGLTGITASTGPVIANADSNVRVLSNAVTIGIQTQPNVVVIDRFNSTFRGNLLPSANVTYNIGSANRAWRDLYLAGNTIYLNTATIQSNATAVTITNELGGRFILDGNGTFSNESIFNGLSAVDIPTANGNIIMRVGLTPDVVVVSNTGATVSGQISATGNITGAYIFGNGSQLTGLPATYSNANVAAFLPTYTGLLSGSSANLSGSITAAGNVLPQAVSAVGNITAGGFFIGDGGFLSNITAAANVAASQLANGTTILSVDGSGGNILTTIGGTANVMTLTPLGIATGAAITAVGNVQGNYFIGNGRFLTGLSPNSIYNGNSEVNIGVPNGNVNVNVGATSNVLVISAAAADLQGTFTATANVNANNVNAVTSLQAPVVVATEVDTNNLVVNTIRSDDSTAVYVTDGMIVDGELEAHDGLKVDGTITTDDLVAANVSATEVNAATVITETLRSDDSTAIRVEDGLITDGDLSVNAELSVIGNITGDSNLSISGIIDAATVTIDTLEANVVVTNFLRSEDSSAIIVNDGLIVDSTVEINDDVTIQGTVTVSGDLSTGGNVTAAALSAALTESPTVITNLLRSDDSSSVLVDDGLIVQGTLEVNDNTTIQGSVSVSEAITADSIAVNTAEAPVITTNLLRSNDSSSILVDDGLKVQGTLEVSEAVTVSANVSIDGSLSVTANITADSATVTQTVSAADINISNNANVIGNISANNIGLVNDATANNISLVGNITASYANINTVAGADVISGNLRVSNVAGQGGSIIATDTIQGQDITATSSVTTDALTANTAEAPTIITNLIRSDDSTSVLVDDGLIVDGALEINSTAAIKGNVTVDQNIAVAANVTAVNVIASDIYGNIFTTLIDSADSSAITITPDVNLSASLIIDQDLTVNGESNFEDISVAGMLMGNNIAATGTISALGNVITAGSFVGNFAGNIVGNLTVPGSNTQVLYNNDGNAGAAAGFTYNSDSNTMTVLGIVSAVGNIRGGNINTANVVSAVGNIRGGNINTANVVSATGNIISSANVVATANVIGGNISTIGLVTATGNVTGGNVNTAGQVTATGNIISSANVVATANVIGGNISTIGLVTATGNVTGGNVNTAGIVTATGNVIGGNLVTTGSITTTGNIIGNIVEGVTQVQSAAVSASGNVTGGNVLTGGFVSATGNLTAGNVSTTGNVNAGNVIADYANINTAAGVDVTGGNLRITEVTGQGGQISAQGNITGANVNTGNLSLSGNIISAANITGNLVANNITALANILASYANINTVAGVDVNSGNIRITNVTGLGGSLIATDIIQGQIVSATGNAIAANLVTTGLITATGNITGNYFFGNGSQLTGIDATSIQNGTANVRTFLNANVAVSAAGVSNVGLFQSTGFTVTGFSSTTGNVIGGNLITAGTVSAVGVISATANVIAGNINTANVVSATGNVIAGNINTTGAVSSTGNVVPGGILLAGGNITGANVISANTIQAISNISVINISTTGNIVADGNISSNASVSAAANVTANLVIANTVSVNSTVETQNLVVNSIYSDDSTAVMIPDGLIVDGILEVQSNVSIAGNVTGNYFLGNGRDLTGINRVVNGTTEITVQTLNGNANVTVGGVSNVAVFTVAGLDVTGAVSASGNITGANLNTIGTANVAQLTVSGSATVTANLSANNISATTSVTAPAVTADEFRGDLIGSVFTDDSTLIVDAVDRAIFAESAVIDGNTQVGNLTTAGSISATGNIAGGNVISSGAVIGNIDVGNIQVSGNVSVENLFATANVSAANIVSTGVISTSGNIFGQNLQVQNDIEAVGVVIASEFRGDLVGSVFADDSSLIVDAIDRAIYADTANIGNIQAGNVAVADEITTDFLTVISNVQANVVSANLAVITTANITGDLSVTSNVLIGGDLTVDGNLTFVNVQTLAVEDPIIGLGRGANNTPLTSNDGRDRGTHLWYYSGAEKGSFFGWMNSSGNMIAATDVTVSGNDIVTVNAYGTFQAGNIYGETLSVVGNAATGNVTTGGIVSAVGNVISGNVNTGIVSATGNVVAGNVNTGIVSATGNVIGNNLVTAGIVSATGNVTTGGIVSAVGNVISGNVNTEIVSATGNVVAGNVSTAIVSATGNVVAGNVNTGIVSATGNIVAGNLNATGLSLSGNVVSTLVSAANITTSANIQADYFIGNGSQLTGLTPNKIFNGNSEANIGTAAGNLAVSISGVANVMVVSPDGVAVAGNITTNNTVSATANVVGGNLVTVGVVTATANIIGNNLVTSNVVAVDGVAANIDLNLAPKGTGNVIANGPFTATGRTILGGTAGNESLQVLNATSGVNYYTIQSATATNGPIFSTDGTDANIPMQFRIKGSGSFRFNTNNTLGTEQFRVSHTASAVNYVQVTGAATGGQPTISAQGSDTNIGLNFLTKGTFNYTFQTGGGIQFGVAHTASAVNYIRASGSAAGAAPSLTSFGSDTNIDLALTPKGTGNVIANGPFSATGNVTGGNLLTGGSIFASGQISAVANVTGGNLTTVGITNTGSLAASTTISAAGNVTGGNILTGGVISATGNVTAGNINTAGLVSTSGSVTATGNVTGGNITTAGIITAAGNIVSATNVIAPTFIGNLQGNITLTGSNSEVLFNDNGVVGSDTGFVFDKVANALTVSGNIVTNQNGNVNVAGLVSVAGNVTTTTGNVSGGNILSGALISAVGNVTGGNLVTGGVVSATGNVTGGNITTTGIVSTSGSVTATGNVVGGNINSNGVVSATGNVRAGGNLIAVGYVLGTGNVTGSNLNTAGIVSATGNVTGGNVISLGDVSVSGLISTTGNVTGGNLVTANTVSAGSASVTGNVSAGNVVAVSGLYGNIFTTLIDSGDSSIITITPDVNFLASVDIDTDLIVGQQLEVPTLKVNYVDTLSGPIVLAPSIVMAANLTVAGVITASTVNANTAINIAGSPVATIDDTVALAIALG